MNSDSGEISPDSSEIWPARFCRNHCAWFARITIENMLGKKKLLLRAFWEKVLELKEIKTFGESVMKIETLMAELKISVNFRRVIRTFPYSLRMT